MRGDEAGGRGRGVKGLCTVLYQGRRGTASVQRRAGGEGRGRSDKERERCAGNLGERRGFRGRELGSMAAAGGGANSRLGS